MLIRGGHVIILKSNGELKDTAKKALQGNWGMCVLVTIVSSLILSLSSRIPVIGKAISIVISGPISLGLVACYVYLIRYKEMDISNLFEGFQNLGSALIIHILKTIFITLGLILFIVPGIIVALRYSMTYYILNDNPNMGAKAALDKSKELMKGNEGKLFLFYISFIGVIILSIITLGVGFFWSIPYISASEAAFYQELKDLNLQTNTTLS